MRFGIVASSFVVGSLSLIVACSSATSGQETGSSSGNNSSGNPAVDGGSSGNADGGQSSSGSLPEASKTEAPVDIDGTCPSLTACGGSISGTYDYTAGCLADAFSAAKAQCPTLDTSGAKVIVKGSLYFSDGELKRAATSTISGSIVVPASCSAGQCATVQAALKNAFDSVTCTGSSSCTCTISNTSATNNDTTYTVSGSTVTTGDGDTYSFCIEGSKLTYKGKAAGSEDGIWSLAKR